MPLLLEDYALLGDCQTAALVGRDGSIDWLCLPRFDAAACFAALLGGPEHGRFRVAPHSPPLAPPRRRYRPGTLVLETETAVPEGRVRIIDFMPLADEQHDLVRIVEGLEGEVPMRAELIVRFDYGAVVPWVRATTRGVRAIAGPDTLWLDAPAPLRGEGLTTVGDFTVRAGERRSFVLTWAATYGPAPTAVDPEAALTGTAAWWRTWCARSTYRGHYQEAVERSLITLKALTYAPTGGIVAAPTTSLPERAGGTRNWDYRYCWLRDATFTLYALLDNGHADEALAFRAWLVNAVAGEPGRAQVLYGVAGERRLDEVELPWLPGYQGARPVRTGNAAHRQHQLDVYGEVLDTLHVARRRGVPHDPDAWRVERALLEFLERDWVEPDDGIWEVRGPRRHFTHSKVMAWVAFDRAIKAAELFGCDGPVARWRACREAIHDEVCRRGFDPARNAFVQAYDSPNADASLLMLPLVGFLPASDPRIAGTVDYVTRQLLHGGLLARYHEEVEVDGLAGDEGLFLLCSFWLADNLALMGRHAEATALFEQLLALRNDVGLLSEEVDATTHRLLGNFPQAFSHVGLVNTAKNLEAAPDEQPAAHRQTRE
jgi:GH15 family glucan-1,4-alpha-glucosidase